LCTICAIGALASIFYQNDFLAIGSALAVVGACVLTGFFGYAECALLISSLRLLLASFIRGRSQLPQQPETIRSRLQGNREWDALWEGLTDYAERFDLCLLQLNVNLPALHEEYHAVWKRKHGADHDQMWQATLPLVHDEKIVGRLRLAGLATSRVGVSGRMSVLIDGLKPFEEQVRQLAAPRPRPDDPAEIRLDLHHRPKGILRPAQPRARLSEPSRSI
jgi:UDP-GlcNAc:undecaprenyl-phosphate GlcNAc-1-phosphate transferase